jgi:starch phosphorylase
MNFFKNRALRFLHGNRPALFYGYSGNPRAWAVMMKNVITKNAVYFNSHRMRRRYATEAYLR